MIFLFRMRQVLHTVSVARNYMLPGTSPILCVSMCCTAQYQIKLFHRPQCKFPHCVTLPTPIILRPKGLLCLDSPAKSLPKVATTDTPIILRPKGLLCLDSPAKSLPKVATTKGVGELTISIFWYLHLQPAYG